MKKHRKLIWKLYPSYLMITLIALFAVSWYTSRSLQHFFFDRTRSDLITQGKLLENQIKPHLVPLDAAALNRICTQIAVSAATRVTVVLPEGKVVGDSQENPAHMDNHRNRPEIVEALKGKIGSAVRFSGTLRQKMMYVAQPLKINDSVQGVLRTALPLTSVDEELRSFQVKIAWGGVFIALLASALCLYISRRISRPIESLRQVAEKFAAGDLKHRLSPPDTLELASLAEAMNQMAIELETRLEAVVKQRNEYEAVLSSMVEGVIAVDRQERILSINQAAVNMFDFSSDDLKGRSIQEVVRNRDFHKLVAETLSGGESRTGDIVLRNNGERILNTQAIALCDADDARIGSLVVLNDVTQIRRLENMRRDFVANVSHEIKTPLTAIKGFVETLLHDFDEKPEDAKRFLYIIQKHVDRLNSIVEDLLALARIEQMDDRHELQLEPRRLKHVIETAVQVVQAKADEKNITFDVDCDGEIALRVDSTLMEQALVNLIENAVKYSPEHSPVKVEAGLSRSELLIHIRDHGCGIAKKHLPRLFERFYRVDKARSRTLGGTGLGLAIVKHIVQVHGGRVFVDSTLGQGSAFTIALPMYLIV